MGQGVEIGSAYIALGSNLGARETNLLTALSSIALDPRTQLLGASPVFETEPVGPGDQGCYLNAAIEVRTERAPLELLDLLQEIELAAGRDRSVAVPRWSARSLDLDILFIGARCIAIPRLSVPHPRAHERDFVLAPMAALAPEFVHPILGKTMAALLSGLGGSQSLRPVPPLEGWPDA